MGNSKLCEISFLTPIPFDKVFFEGGLFSQRWEVNREKTIPIIYKKFQEVGHLNALELCAPQRKKEAANARVHPYWDSDVAKWIEAASYSLALHPDPHLESIVDDVIAKMTGAQQEDGYLNTYYTTVEPEYRWKKLAFGHELYSAGHLIEAGVAHYRSTGKTTLLSPIRRYADYIYSVFSSGECTGYPGHPEIELALFKLYRLTGDKRYFRLSQLFLERRGHTPSYFALEMETLAPEHLEYYNRYFGSGDTFTTEYCQDHLPLREQTHAVGHAVRAMYLYSAFTDVAAETNDMELIEVCKNLWEDITEKHMYITGGIGSSRENEGFTRHYDLPNLDAYAETCAAIGLVFFSHRLLQADPDSRYGDVMERAIYNVILQGVSSDGCRFTYDNPLESLGDHRFHHWFEVACCPPNLARFIASLGEYVYSYGEKDIYIHLYAQGKGECDIHNSHVGIVQRTHYPWDGNIEIEIIPEDPVDFGLNVRIPCWSLKEAVLINGKPTPMERNVQKGYMSIKRVWKAGDVVHLSFPMSVNRVYSHPAVRQNIGHVALQRGPVVFCLEEMDQPGIPLSHISLPRQSVFNTGKLSETASTMPVIHAQAQRIDSDSWNKKLYGNLPCTLQPCNITAVPYCTWNNRTSGEMKIWMRESGNE